MLETSPLLLIQTIILYMFQPMILGYLIIALWNPKNLNKGILIAISRFVGIALSSSLLIVLQFFHTSLYTRFSPMLILMLIGLLLRQQGDVLKHRKSTKSLTLSFERKGFSFGFSIFLSVYILAFLFAVAKIGFTIPNFFDDSFGNWHKPVVNILHDGGITFFGNENEILARGRVGYPLHVSLLKANYSSQLGGWNDIYGNTLQILSFIFFILLIFSIQLQRSAEINRALLPCALIISLPLVFFHAFSGYLDLFSAIYSIVIVYLLYKFEDGKFNDFGIFYLALILFGFLIYIKNDGFIVYGPAILVGYMLYLLSKKQVASFFTSFNITKLIATFLIIIFSWIPFFAVKTYLGLGFNQASGETSGVTFSYHPEIFSVIPDIFLEFNNYNVLGLLLLVLIFQFVKIKDEKGLSFLAVLTSMCMIILFLLVFLFTENARFLLNQTTVNRVFTMSFVVLLAFIDFLPKSHKYA